MSWLLLAFALAGPVEMPEKALTPVVQMRCGPRAVRCRWECLCFRNNGYRCRRYYTEPCAGRACWQCQAQLTARARKSCAIGSPVKRCWCKFMKL